MAVPKRSNYSERILLVADVAKAIAHPARVTMIRHLHKHQVGDNATFQLLTLLHKATVTQHLKELEKVGLIHVFYQDGGKCRLTNHSPDLLSVLQSVSRFD